MEKIQLNRGAILHHLLWPIGIGVFSAFLQTSDEMFPSFGELEGRIARSLFAWGILLVVTDLMNRLIGRKLHLFIRLCVVVIIAAVPISFFVPWVTFALGLVPGKVVFPSVEPSDILADFPGLYIFVLQVTFLTWIAGNYQRYRKMESSGPLKEAASPQVQQVQTSEKPAFLAKITKRIGDDIIALKSEQHYLRVYTTKGDDMILYRLSDAISELGSWDKAGEGLQVHRSYWVAKSAVSDIARDGKLATITLSNGEEIPVSRNRLKALKEAGWL